MNYKPIIVVAGEPYSVFSEIFFKAKKNYRFKRPIILIASKTLLLNNPIFQFILLFFDFEHSMIE